MLINDNLLFPRSELVPDYKISPFCRIDIKINSQLPYSNSCDDYFDHRFKEHSYQYTYSGREAINIALSNYNLSKSDCVTILTTSGNFYISGCVTNEIEKYCQWSRKIEYNTKVILVNHEFGYPFRELTKIKEYGIPIIEDCAYSFFSNDNKEEIGTVGDFIIYSFPKYFPLQFGGLLVSNIAELNKTFSLRKEENSYIKKVISHYLNFEDDIKQKRINNHNFLEKKFRQFGFVERFELEEGVVPGVFLFKTNKQIKNLPELKNHFYAHGVQCSVFYGEDAFYIPVNQSLFEIDLEYFVNVIKVYLENSNN